MPLIPYTTGEQPSNSETSEDNKGIGMDVATMKKNIEQAMDNKGEQKKRDSIAAGEKQASDAERAANKLYDERIEEEYEKREDGS